ncbi:MAG: hypothetical protein AAF446_05515 [Pseudomonadota bacterium]
MFGLSRKTVNRSLIALFSIGLVAGCASGPETFSDTSVAESASYADKYIWHVEQSARRNNVQVFWVNPPRNDPRSADNQD